MNRRSGPWLLPDRRYGWDLLCPLPKDRSLPHPTILSRDIIETVIARDVLQILRITKPTILRHIFALAAWHPAQIHSSNKMLGQLQDAGNTTTLAHYLRLLEIKLTQ